MPRIGSLGPAPPLVGAEVPADHDDRHEEDEGRRAGEARGSRGGNTRRILPLERARDTAHPSVEDNGVPRSDVVPAMDGPTAFRVAGICMADGRA